MRVATVVLVRDSHGQILGVTRKNDHTAWGIPGGKFDPEDGDPTSVDCLRTAASRELWEETGLQDLDLQYVGVNTCGDFQVHAFKATAPENWTPQEIPGEGMVGWVTEKDLLTGPFGEYNQWLLQQP